MTASKAYNQPVYQLPDAPLQGSTAPVYILRPFVQNEPTTVLGLLPAGTLFWPDNKRGLHYATENGTVCGYLGVWTGTPTCPLQPYPLSAYGIALIRLARFAQAAYHLETFLQPGLPQKMIDLISRGDAKAMQKIAFGPNTRKTVH